ncbi:uncharacterized protein ARMOST_08707 [Armillaria ostoyae]|uniref:Uncharacterized protein n=1 Tax=Armillaria ostoyae TaxID=47428 RepID=A0A284R9F4_ARMOS|nr:uncharacterized protein ARMOST_08707 [Armillaria ostoyae]
MGSHLPSACPGFDAEQLDLDKLSTNTAVTTPVGIRAFRKTIQSPYGKGAVCTKVVITTDNGYSIYANGQTLGP